MPTQALVFAGLFSLSDHLLMIARCFNGICAATVVIAAYLFAHATFVTMPARRRTLMATGIGLPLLFNP